MSKKKNLPETNNPKPREYAPDEVNEHREYIKIGGSPFPGLTLRQVLRGHTDGINRIAWSPDGKYLASPSDDKTIRIWDGSTGECIRILEGHTGGVRSVSWSPDNQSIASGSSDCTFRLWDASGNCFHTGETLLIDLSYVSWSPDGTMLAISFAENVLIWNSNTNQQIANLHGPYLATPGLVWFASGEKLGASTANKILVWDIDNWAAPKQSLSSRTIEKEGIPLGFYDILRMPNKEMLATGSTSGTIHLWDSQSLQETLIVEGHTDNVFSLSFSLSGDLLASKSSDGTCRLWNSLSWTEVAKITEPTLTAPSDHGSIRFHPHLPILATLGEKGKSIRIWELDESLLLGQAKENVNYTTAKLVLVGDSGVGKTGLGWRMAHGEFKEHASTHGQQFWSIPQLGLKRKDGTDCEAVLWDLAGQHVYRQVHSIFLENVAAALVVFDPTNRQEPLKGAQFWLEQLKGKGQLPPTVLVGARVDRGAPALSQAELDQFCQRYGIKGGYLSTSALKGEGLDELLDLLKAQIPWDDMTATVTTITFKRIKDYVLSLKEETDRKEVLVSPSELRKLLETSEASKTSEVWEFTDAEMMTAVGHLDTHGYVTVLRNSVGDQTILLKPDLLVNLAASIMLLADKNPRELGAVSETELLQGKYPFDELKGLEQREAQTLLDAAILRFLEHNICFRDTFNDDTLLIFPSLIKQKRPLQDDSPATDDISYVVRGRVENLYASLVVLLGYTPSFSRINQWQNQAQYEMREGEICGFRSIEEREGELELVLYYGDKMTQKGRGQFQELFEQFLHQRDVEVTRFLPVVCKNQHRIERATVVKRVREGKDFVFCGECGDKTFLPDFDQPQTIGIGASPWLQREGAMARLRSSYEVNLTRIKSYRRSWATPCAYLSCLPEQKEWAKKLIHDLHDAGVYIVEGNEDLDENDFVIVLDTLAYQKAFQASSATLAMQVVRTRLGSKKLLSLSCEGGVDKHDFKRCKPGNFCDETHYVVSLFDLVLNLYAIPLTHSGFEPLRQSLHEQWERTLASLPPMPKDLETITNLTSPNMKRFNVALSFPGEYRKQIATIAEHLSEALGKERVFYDKYYEAELARPDLDTYIQSIYHDHSELVVVFLCAEYDKKEWCGLEWRAVRDLLKKKETAAIMPMRFDDTQIPGLFSIDGYVDIANRNLDEVAQLILQRLDINRKT